MGTPPLHQGDAPQWADANCRAVLEAAPDAMLVVNRAGEIVAANLQAEKLYGYSREHLIGRVVESLIPARLRDRHRQHRENFFANPEMQTMQVIEIFAVLSDASEIPVGVSLSLLTIGTETFAISAIRDATERRRIEGLKASAGRRGRLVQNSSVAMLVTHGLEHKVELLNDKFTALLGYTIDDIPDVAHWWPLAYPDKAYRQAVRSEWETRTEKALRDGTPFAPMEVTVRCKDGSTRHLEVHLSTMAGDTNLVTFIDLTERKLAEEALRTSEERLRMGQWAARIGTYEWNIRTGVSIWTPELEALYGLPPGGFGGTRDAFENLVHPDDRARVTDLVDEAIKNGQPAEGEWRVVWPDGSLHWIAARGQVFLNESGEPSRMFGVHLDVTERKQAEEAMSGMTRKLVEAQEQERARIARELHDDITQRLAMLAIEIEQVEEHAETPSEVRDRADKLSKRTKEISTDVQALSHELHSSKLDYLGIVGGMKSWCNEFGERQGMEIEFKSSGLPNSLPSEISLCLFRVLQEALNNAAKHSGVKRVDVQLREESCEIHLIVSDLGKGFDVASAMQDRGLGVTSMQERVRLVGGTIVIDSKPLGGTTIHVRVPLGAERSFQRAPE